MTGLEANAGTGDGANRRIEELRKRTPRSEMRLTIRAYCGRSTRGPRMSVKGRFYWQRCRLWVPGVQSSAPQHLGGVGPNPTFAADGANDWTARTLLTFAVTAPISALAVSAVFQYGHQLLKLRHAQL